MTFETLHQIVTCNFDLRISNDIYLKSYHVLVWTIPTQLLGQENTKHCIMYYPNTNVEDMYNLDGTKSSQIKGNGISNMYE